VVRDGTDGLLVRARDATGLAERIEALAADPSMRARMGGSARAFLERGFTWRHYGERVSSVWAEGLR
jgi:glycosyltransferase involved in cell wall biosynthesis